MEESESLFEAFLRAASCSDLPSSALIFCLTRAEKESDRVGSLSR